MKKYVKYIPPILMGIAILCSAIYLLTHEGFSVAAIVHFTPKNPVLAAVILWILYAIKGMTAVILYDALVLAAAFMYDTPTALFVNAVGTVICICIPYWIGRCLRGPWLERTLAKHEKVRRLYREHERHPAVGCLMIRTMGLSNEALGLLFGSTGMKFVPFLLCSFCGISPGMICITILGSELTLRSFWFWFVLAIDIIMIVGAHWYHKRTTRRGDHATDAADAR